MKKNWFYTFGIFIVLLLGGSPLPAQPEKEISTYKSLYEKSEAAVGTMERRMSQMGKEIREKQREIDNLWNYIHRNGLLPPGPTFPFSDGGSDVSGRPGENENNNPVSKNTPSRPVVDVSEYTSKIRSLEEQLTSLSIRIETLLTAHQKEIAGLKSDFRSKLNEASSDLKVLQTQLDEAEKVLDCVKAATKMSASYKARAEPELKAARERFATYSNLLAAKQDSRTKRAIAGHLDFIFATYNKYDSRPIDTICGGMVIRDVVEFTTAADHLKMASILAKDPRHLVNHPRYGGSTDQRAARLNADLIYHVSQIYEKQNDYANRSDANKLVSEDLLELLNVLPAALLASENINAIDTAARSNIVQGLYGEIPGLFERERYVTALGVYNRFQRLEDEEGLRDKILLRAKVHLAAGTIMLYDLGEVSQVYGVTLNGTWLRGQMPNLQANGAEMLKGVMTMEATRPAEETEMRKCQERAAYLLSKWYIPENRAEKERRKQLRRQRKGKVK